ncbi:MAG: transposase [Gammaproteobacteria bacterium]|jgi:putative transposase
MPRRARLALGGIPWHIIQRGNNRSACFFSSDDYVRYLDILFEQAEVQECSIHAFVLMTNHAHLLLTPRKASGPGRLMKHLGQRYVQHVNRIYQRSGTLWEGRYKSTLVGSTNYILACYRYIEMNPVRAGMVDHPGEYRWSSYGANAQGSADYNVTPNEEYFALGETDIRRLEAYRGLFKSEIDPDVVDEIRVSTNSNYALGNDRFKDQIEGHLKRRARPGRSGRPSSGSS